MNRRHEIASELRAVGTRASLLDAVVGPATFAIVNAFRGATVAAVVGLALAGLLVLFRLVRRSNTAYALGGVAGTVLASSAVLVTGRPETYYLPGIVGGAVTSLAMIVSIVVKRPLLALTSAVVRSWPLGWYWHPLVRPAYTMASWLWAGFFAARAILQYVLYRDGAVGTLAAVRVATGWPALLVLLVVTYLLGRRRLEALGGPSVDEWESGGPPPWKGQEHGF